MDPYTLPPIGWLHLLIDSHDCEPVWCCVMHLELLNAWNIEWKTSMIHLENLEIVTWEELPSFFILLNAASHSLFPQPCAFLWVTRFAGATLSNQPSPKATRSPRPRPFALPSNYTKAMKPWANFPFPLLSVLGIGHDSQSRKNIQKNLTESGGVHWCQACPKSFASFKTASRL